MLPRSATSTTGILTDLTTGLIMTNNNTHHQQQQQLKQAMDNVNNNKLWLDELLIPCITRLYTIQSYLVTMK